MHGTWTKRFGPARNAADTNVSESATDDRNVTVADTQWFSAASRLLLAPKPGLFLHLKTDCGERNGHRYASGEVAVPSYVIRQLLRSEHGAQWLAAIMDGSDAQWWLDHQRAERITAQVDQLNLD